MNNLHRELAPVSDAAWESIEDEARRTFGLNLAGRKVADVTGPSGLRLAAVPTGHLGGLEPPSAQVTARAYQSQPLVQLRVPFVVDREAVDSVERGAADPDWEPVKEAARQMALAEDTMIFAGYPAAGVAGIAVSSSNRRLRLPAGVTDYPDVISHAVTMLRLAGVGGPYSLLLSPDAYTAVNETSDHGYPVIGHLDRLIDGQVVWAPAVTGAFVVSGRGGDHEIVIGQDLSIGYLSHDDVSVRLYFQESLTFLAHTAEASVVLDPVAVA